MPNFSKMFAASAAIGMALAAPAFAEPISVGSSVNGTLSPSDQRNEMRGTWMDTYELPLAANQGVEITMNSEEGMDTVVIVGIQHDDGYFEEYAYNDDRGDGTLNSRLVFSAPFDGTYTIQATSFSGDTTGSYSLAVEETVIVPPPTPRPLGVGETLSGSFGANSPRLDWSMQPYDLFTFDATAGEIVVFTMNSEAFDSYLEIGQTFEWGFEPFYSDDDSGGNLNARLVYRFPDSGSYTVRAMGLYETSEGPFTISAESYPVQEEPRPTPIRMNQIMRGELVEGGVINMNMQYYDVYSLRVRAGQEVRITMRSETLDSVLEVGTASPAGFAIATYDDDSGGGIYGLDAQVEFTAESSGTLIIRASSLSPMTPGEYSISVE